MAVAVRDYGVGLKPGEATRVFSRFWRADPARARTTGGTGLGLSIALEDARLHGGWLQAWGEPGGGSQFRLTVPRTADEPLRGSPIPLEPADSRRNQGAQEAEQKPVRPVAPAPRTDVATTVLHAPGVGLARLSAAGRAGRLGGRGRPVPSALAGGAAARGRSDGAPGQWLPGGGPVRLCGGLQGARGGRDGAGRLGGCPGRASG